MRSVSESLGLGIPVALRAIADVLEPVTLSFTLDAGTCSGECRLRLASDGSVQYAGRVHDSGALSASYAAIVSISLVGSADGPFLFPRRGHVGGTFSFESRDDDWDMNVRHTLVEKNWTALKAGLPSARVDFGTGTGAIELITGLASAATGGFVIPF
ncbi:MULTISPECIES: hypothetical protein [unclassified Mesorhizobium]|uniref:hypothetical protein n=1 Tax=unclassified Mesorhizobium TaxID=325217 RepID=UPI003337B705